MNDFKHLSRFLHGFVPGSALLCSVEGDPPGDGGGAPPNAPPPADAPPDPPTFTAEQEAMTASLKKLRLALDAATSNTTPLLK